MSGLALLPTAPKQIFAVLMGHAVGAGNDADPAAIHATWGAGGGRGLQ